MSGFVKLHRDITKWEWYDDINCSRVFIHLILKVNYKSKVWQGKIIKRGQLITSVKKLSNEVGLSNEQTRLVLKKLSQGTDPVITTKTTNKYTVVTVCKYDFYQDIEGGEQQTNNNQTTNETTNKEQSNNKQQNNQTTTTKEYKEEKNIKKDTTSVVSKKEFSREKSDSLGGGGKKEKKVPPKKRKELSPPSVDDMKETQKLLEYLRSDEETKDRVMMRAKITGELYDKLLSDFVLRQSTGRVYQNYRDMYNHFGNWLPKKIQDHKNNLANDGNKQTYEDALRGVV